MNNYRTKLTTAQKNAVMLSILAIFLARPCALGLVYSVFGYCLLIVSSIYLYNTTKTTSYNYANNCKVMFAFYLLYAVVDFALFFEIYHATIHLIIFVFICMMFRNEEVRFCFFSYFKNFIIFLVLCAIINFLLENFFDVDALLIVQDYVKTDNYQYSLYFPLTSSNNLWYFPENIPIIGGVHVRQYYFFVEPGMVPPFFLSLIYIILPTYNQKSKKIVDITVIIIGVFLTMSTGGPIMLFASVAVYYFYSRKKKFSIFSLALVTAFAFFAYYSYNYMPYFGKQAKIEMNAAQAESIETHENILSYVLYQTAIIACMALFQYKNKFCKKQFITIASLLCIGNLSNYIMFTPLSTIFLFWDYVPRNAFLKKH